MKKKASYKSIFMLFWKQFYYIVTGFSNVRDPRAVVFHTIVGYFNFLFNLLYAYHISRKAISSYLVESECKLLDNASPYDIQCGSNFRISPNYLAPFANDHMKWTFEMWH